jgi:hypothetical protein
VLLLLALPAWAAPRTATVSGAVRNSSGEAQMGAVVEVIAASGSVARRVYSDEGGRYAAGNLVPGTYSVRVSAASFLPALRENVRLAKGTHLLLNVTLNTLFEAIQMLPRRRNTPQEDDDWKWTLRSVGNRPILRVLDDGKSILVSDADTPDDRRLKAHVTFVAGNEAAGFGSSADATTAFVLEHSMFSSGTLGFQGNIGYANGQPGGVLRATYSHQLAGSRPEIALTARRFATLSTVPQYGALEAYSLSASNTIAVADFLEVTAGSEFQMVQFARQVHALRPYGTVDVHLGKDMVLEYRYASSQPSTRAARGFDTAPRDLSESGPRMSLAGDQPVLERARHHELSLSRRFGRTRLQAAAYMDQIFNAALLGAGDVTADSGDYLPDVYSSTFTWNGGDLSTTGARLVMQQEFSDAFTGTLEYSTGGVIAVADQNLTWDVMRASLRQERRHAVAAKLSGRAPRTKTRWIASYRWTNGRALTPVDWFDASPGQADPYFSVFVRQPVPQVGFLPLNMEVLVDVRNLLAQGYVPVIGHDGQTLYLVQAARSVRGGLAFNF